MTSGETWIRATRPPAEGVSVLTVKSAPCALSMCDNGCCHTSHPGVADSATIFMRQQESDTVTSQKRNTLQSNLQPHEPTPWLMDWQDVWLLNGRSDKRRHLPSLTDSQFTVCVTLVTAGRTLVVTTAQTSPAALVTWRAVTRATLKHKTSWETEFRRGNKELTVIQR